VALTFGFYNSINHDRKYDAIQVGQIFDGIIHDGVYETYKNAMIVKESSQDNQVIIQPGRAWFDHTWSYNDSDYAMNMPAPESFLDRIDAVVLDVNSNSNYRMNSFVVVNGTPSASPARPVLIREAGHNQYPLCYVYRHGGQNHIYQADITNTVGTSACPFVTGVIEGLNIDDLISQWNDEFSRWMITKRVDFESWENQQKTDFENWESTQKTDFENWEYRQKTDFENWEYRQKTDFEIWKTYQETGFFTWIENTKQRYYDMLDHNSLAWNNWFSHIQTQLDGDVAGHLQQEIDQIAKFASIYVVDKVLYVPMSAASVEGEKLIFARK
jgi:hypothetical protein